MNLRFDAQLGQRNFDVSFDVEGGQRVAILGPNGSGKSTLLAILAGILRPDTGFTQFGDDVLFDLSPRRVGPRGQKGLWTKPYTRGVSLLSQDPLLFPHLNVWRNVQFGPRSQGVPGSEAKRIAEYWLSQVEAADLARRKPSELSGGQAQRVAIARALAGRPRLLLLDEPLAALDVAVALQLRRVLREVLREQTTLLVTHDLLDAALLSDRVIVLEGGAVVEEGPTEQVFRHPKTKFTAGLAGLNLVRGTYREGGVEAAGGLRIEGALSGISNSDRVAQGQEVAAMFPPSAVSVFPNIVGGSPRNNIWVEIEDLEPKGELVRVRGSGVHSQSLSADLTLGSVADLDLYPGKRVVFSVKAAAVVIYEI